MAKIYFNIEATDVDDLHDTLHSLLKGSEHGVSINRRVTAGETTTYKDILPQTAAYVVKEAFKKDAPEPAMASGIVAHPEVKEAQATENARIRQQVEAALNPELDAHGHPWSADLHASTKAQTKDGLWRMKPGAARPAPAPGYPTTGETTVPPTASEPEQPLTPVEQIAADAGVDATDEDEFAAFKSEASTEAPAVPEREWTDADLSKLCNQAATKMGSPEKIKELIGIYASLGTVPHSRNIPVEDRERFAGEVEALAGITYEG